MFAIKVDAERAELYRQEQRAAQLLDEFAEQELIDYFNLQVQEYTDETAVARDESRAESAILSAEESAQKDSDQLNQAPPDQRGTGFALEAESNEQIAARGAAQQAAEVQQQADADKAEEEAKKAREAAEIASRQGVAAENFSLDAQVNNKTEQRQADAKRADDQLAGQGDIFGANPQPSSPLEAFADAQLKAAQALKDAVAQQGATSEFIKAPDGSIDFGEITPEQGAAMRRQAGKIRLERGDDTYGEQHIELRHGKDIRALGFSSVSEFVADIAAHVDQIWKPDATAQLVAIHQVSNDRVMFVELRPAKDSTGDFYTVRSAFPARAGFVKNKGWDLLWEGRAQPSANANTSAPFADPRQTKIGGAGTIPSGSGSTIPASSAEGNHQSRTLALVSIRKVPAARDFDSIARTLLSNARSDGGSDYIVINHQKMGFVSGR